MSNEEQEAIFDSSKEIKWGGWLNEFLWVCAGVNRKVLRQCPTDYAKYAGIGGTILFTALMACLSGGYALSFVFDNDAVGVAFGIFWGMLIFNLDRFIVNTMYSDGKVTISARELKAGLPRIIMAIFLGIVISYPLELRLFDDEIKKHNIEKNNTEINNIEKDYEAKIQACNNRKDSIMGSPSNTFETARMLSSERGSNWLKQRDNARTNETTARTRLGNLQAKKRKLEAENTNGKHSAEIKKISSDISDINKKIRQYKQDANMYDAKLLESDAEYAKARENEEKNRGAECNKLVENIDTLNKEKKIAIDACRAKQTDYTGLQAQMLAFSEIKDESMSTQIASILIMLLFIIIETAPTFFKMMIASGPYDDLLRAEMHRVRVLSDKRISDINDEVNTSVEISVAKNKERLEAEMAANKEVLTQVAVAQARLIEYAIKEWEKVERTKIEKDPSAYIRGFEPTVEVSSTRTKKGKKHRGRKAEQSVPTEIHGRESETLTEPEAVDEPENTAEPQPGNE